MLSHFQCLSWQGYLSLTFCLAFPFSTKSWYHPLQHHIWMSSITKDPGWHVRSTFVCFRELNMKKEGVTELIPAEQVPPQEGSFSLNHSCPAELRVGAAPLIHPLSAQGAVRREGIFAHTCYPTAKPCTFFCYPGWSETFPAIRFSPRSNPIRRCRSGCNKNCPLPACNTKGSSDGCWSPQPCSHQ